MEAYSTKDQVDRYAAALAGQDGEEHVLQLEAVLPKGSLVLELGSGPGVDLLLLRRSFEATGSDPSLAFRQHFAQMHPHQAGLVGIDAGKLQAAAFSDHSLDAIFSNKVLHQLSEAEHRSSILQQRRLLSPGGWALHTYWNRAHWRGAEPEVPETDPRRFAEAQLHSLWSSYQAVSIEPYSSLGHHDSLRVLAQA